MFLLYIHKIHDFTFFGNYTFVPINSSHLHLQASFGPPLQETKHHKQLQYVTKWEITVVRKKISSILEENKSVTMETSVVMTFIWPLFCSLCWEKGRTGFKQLERVRECKYWRYLILRFGYQSFLLSLNSLGSISWYTKLIHFLFAH